MAWEKAKRRKHKVAIRLYEDSLKNNANNWQTWHGYAWSLSRLKHYNTARNAFFIAIRLKDNDSSWHQLGKNYFKQANHAMAIHCYAEAIKLNPENELALHDLKISQKYLKAEKKKVSKWYRVTAKPQLRVRLKPSVFSKKVGVLDNSSLVKLVKFIGKKQTIAGYKNRWALVEYKGGKAYVYGAYITLVN